MGKYPTNNKKAGACAQNYSYQHFYFVSFLFWVLQINTQAAAHICTVSTVLPESAPTWQCWDQQWTSDAANSRWDIAPPSDRWVSLPPSLHPLGFCCHSLPGFPLLTWLMKDPWCWSAGCRWWPQVVALLRLANRPLTESGPLHCPGNKDVYQINLSSWHLWSFYIQSLRGCSMHVSSLNYLSCQKCIF